MAIKVLGVSGSMREGSSSRRALTIVLEAARAQEGEAETRLLDLRELDLPMYRPQPTMQNESVLEAGKQSSGLMRSCLRRPIIMALCRAR